MINPGDGRDGTRRSQRRVFDLNEYVFRVVECVCGAFLFEASGVGPPIRIKCRKCGQVVTWPSVAPEVARVATPERMPPLPPAMETK